MGNIIVQPISQFALGDEVQSTDLYIATDTTDNTQSPVGTTKHYTIAQLQSFLGVLLNNSNIPSVRCIAAAALNATYSNGSSGVGATLTNAGLTIPLVLDGVTVANGDRVGVFFQVDTTQNGIYTVTTKGSVSTNWVLTRATDQDNHVSGEVASGDFVIVPFGDAYALTIWINVSTDPVVIGTSPILFNESIPNGSVQWLNVTGTTQAMTVNHGYITSNAASTAYSFPLVAPLGSVMEIAGVGAGGWVAHLNAGQSVIANGISGSNTIQSNAANDCIRLLTIVADTTFLMIGANGSNISLT